MYHTILDEPPIPLGIVTTLEETSDTVISFNLTWNSTFNSEYAITSYKITLGPDSSKIMCPYSCSPNDPCQCNGLARGDSVTICISAVNCGDQEGLDVEITVTSNVEGPGMN